MTDQSAPLHVVILAAGQGSRMRSNLPKVLHAIGGHPMLHHVIGTARELGAEATHVVIGHGADSVRETTPDEHIHWVLQEEQLGTGHAVAQALPGLPEDARVLVLYGDVPLIATRTLADLVAPIDSKTMGLLTVTMDDPDGYGRILRDKNGKVQAIVEQKDATEDQLGITEVNTGILALTAAQLRDWLPVLSSDNAQGEYYLTDVIEMAANQGVTVQVAHPATAEEVQGVNNRIQLAELERYYQRCQAQALMTDGATLLDPARVDVRGKVSVGRDVIVDANVILEGEVRIADNVRIGANCVIRDSVLKAGARVDSHSIIDGSELGEDTQVGPFARLRPGTRLAARAKVGNFVETKKAEVGEGSKINHLSYVGDATLGASVNVGAGTITCNYDGVNKHHTEIGDRVFVGSNTSIVAPVSVAAGATLGAGSTITRDVETDELAVARGKQRNISGWKRPTKQSDQE